MSGFTVQLSKRDFSGLMAAPGGAWSVEQLTWRAVGGPWSARLRVMPDASGLAGLWGLADLLRCGLTVFDEAGAAWWGYVAGVEIRAGGLGRADAHSQPAAAALMRVALDGMSNRVAVRYRDFSPAQSGGAPRMTGWVTDADSIARYGTKERVFQLGAVGDASAAAFAQAMLARSGSPAALAAVSAVAQAATGAATAAGPYAVVEARGWWETLDWVYASDGRGRVDSTAGGSQQKIGDAAANTRLAQAFNPGGWTLSEVWIKAGRTLAADNLVVSILSNAGGWPGSVLASATVAASALRDEIEWVRVPLAYPFAEGTNYFLQVARSGALDAAKWFTVSVDQSKGFTGGAMLLYNGANWAFRSPDADLTFLLLGAEGAGSNIARLLGPGMGGQFISGVRMEASPAVLQMLYRDGSQRARAAVEDLLAGSAGAGSLRLLARVEPDRTARVYAMPAPESARLVVRPDGQVTQPDGRPLLPGEFPAGQWARLGPLADAAGAWGAVFVEECAWEAGRWWVGGE